MTLSVSRREFLGQAPASAVLALLVSTPPPTRAWVITEPDWHYNDEFTYADGEVTRATLYYDLAAAEIACRALNDRFYAGQSPQDFELDWETYFPDGLPDGNSEDEITWDEVKRSGWTDPFLLLELTLPGDAVDE